MASIKPIKAEYSPKLDGMTAYIRAFLSKNLSGEAISRTHKGIADFCYKNSSTFKKEFLDRAGLQKLKKFSGHSLAQNQSTNFVSKLSQMDAECVFLLKDTYNILNSYQEKTGKGFGLLVNRNFLCRTEEDYFILVNIIYKTLAESENVTDFSEKYFVEFQKLIENDEHFYDRAKKLFEYVIASTNSQKVIFVDLGFQFTFSLFCSASVRHFGSGKIETNFYSFSTYPWLQDFFKNKYFSENSEAVLDLELQAINDFESSLQDKAKGAFVGFAIGDALGFPIAGIDKIDVPKFISQEITEFTNNPKHPFFSHLKSGQYTENTNLLIISAQHLIKNKGFVVEKYQDELAKWGKKILKNPDAERWAGPTAINAVKNLIEGKSYLVSGSTTTESCSATYRVVPIGIFYHPFSKNGIDALKSNAEISAMITHNSEISKTGAVITALIIGNLIHNLLPEKAVLGASVLLQETDKNKLLIEKIKQAVDFSKTKDVDFARKTFGTGSPIYQTLPLAIFCFLKFQNDFEKAVIAGANSYRDDTQEEKVRLAKFSWEEQLQYAKGGNTDGIAGLTGAFVGAHLGVEKIPRKFLSIENREALETLANKLL